MEYEIMKNAVVANLLAAILAAPSALAAPVSEAKASVETPTMGWSSWNAFRVNISEGTIKHHASLVKELGLDKCGYVYINIDDGYFGGRDENGRLKTHPTRFPNGLKPVVDHIHSLGLRAGILGCQMQCNPLNCIDFDAKSML